MSDFLKFDGVLDRIYNGYCFWRNPEDDTSIVTDLLLNKVLDSSDVHGGNVNISLVGDFFLISSRDQKKTALRNVSSIQDAYFLDIGVGYSKVLLVGDGSAYYCSGSGIFNLNYKHKSIRFIYVINESTVFISYFEGGVIFATRNGKVEHRNWNGSTLWSVDVNQILSSVGNDLPFILEAEFSSEFIGNNAVIHLSNNGLVCIDGKTGGFRWYLENALEHDWSFDCNNRIVGVYDSRLRIIDSETGVIIAERKINAEWAVSDRYNRPLHLYRSLATETHLWAGFMGRGLCAINLDNGDVDYHVFDGGLCDSKPKVVNNRVFVAIRSGGLGLESQRQEYILEGAGGYKPDSEGFFAIP